MKAGWEFKPLGEIAKLHYGKALAKSERNPEGTVPIYGANGVLGWSDHVLSEGPSLIVGRKGSAGEVNRVDGPFWPSDVTYYTEHDHEKLDFDFFHYGMLTLDIPSLAKGVKPGINRNEAYALNFPIPPFEEQKRIVAVLDAAFEGLTRAKENAETNLQNARELFEAALSDIVIRDVSRFGEISVANLALEVTDGDHMPPPKSETGIPFLTISNINKETRQLDFTSTFMVPESYFNELKGKRKPRKNDVLYTVTGATLGIPVLVKEGREFCFQRHIGLVRPGPATHGAWLYFMLMSSHAFNQATAGASGAAQKTVSLRTLRAISLPDTPAEKQKKRSDLLDEIWKYSRNSAEAYRTKLADIANLRQSLLQKAFAGELT